MRNRIKLLIAVLIIILVIAAYFIAKNMLHVSNQTDNDWVGISLHSLNPNEAQLVEESGAGWIRIDCFKGFDTDLANATTHGLKVLAILDSWMFGESVIFTLEEWRDNVTYYVSQYADSVDAWEIWNEPANPNYTLLDLSIPSEENMSLIVQFYFSMVKNASQIIRQYDPTAKIVLFGGLNLFSGGDPHLELDKNFSKQLAIMNIESYGDAFSVHAYPWTNNTKSWNCHTYDDALAYYRELFPSLEVWVTETGHYIEDVEGEEGQARYMRDALQYFKGRVTRLFWYSLRDNPGEEKHFGLIDACMQPRRAYCELKNELN